MKKIFVIICSLFGFVSNGQIQKRNISFENREVELDIVDELLKKHIKNKTPFKNGIKEIEDLLILKNGFLITDLEIENLTSEFNEFIKTVFNKNKLPKNIKAFNFGLFTSIENNKEHITLYLSGSEITPKENFEDWNVEPLYFPKYYFINDYFDNIKSSNPKMSGELEVLVFNGIMNLLIMENIDFLKEEIVNSEDKFYIGCGFDSGDCYILGILNKNGMK